VWPLRFEPRAAALNAASAARRAVGERLLGATLYGSVVTGEFHPAHSDVNVAFVLSALGADELEALRGAQRTWARSRVERPLLLSRETLARSLDTFPLEYLLIRERHEPLLGEDFFGGLAVDRGALRLQVERVLRAQELGLGLSYVALAATRSGARHWAARAASAIAASASGLLWLREGTLPATRRELAERSGVSLGVDAAAFTRLLTLRVEPHRAVEARQLLDSALRILNRLTEVAEGLDAPRA
jgi:predicted nucleotidyltransferase